MLLIKNKCNMNRIGFWWHIKTANIEYYDIQYAAEWTIDFNCVFYIPLKLFYVTFAPQIKNKDFSDRQFLVAVAGIEYKI